jgi:hypothetical protein
MKDSPVADSIFKNLPLLQQLKCVKEMRQGLKPETLKALEAVLVQPNFVLAALLVFIHDETLTNDQYHASVTFIEKAFAQITAEVFEDQYLNWLDYIIVLEIIDLKSYNISEHQRQLETRLRGELTKILEALSSKWSVVEEAVSQY